jgi:hypothetical protein
MHVNEVAPERAVGSFEIEAAGGTFRSVHRDTDRAVHTAAFVAVDLDSLPRSFRKAQQIKSFFGLDVLQRQEADKHRQQATGPRQDGVANLTLAFMIEMDRRPFHCARAADDRAGERISASYISRIFRPWSASWPSGQFEPRGRLADDAAILLASWASDETMLRRILVDNPAQLYGFRDSAAPGGRGAGSAVPVT